MTSLPDNWIVGEYKVRGLFWTSEVNHEEKTCKVVSQEIMCDILVSISKDMNLSDFIYECLQHTNKELPKFLVKNGLKRWLPARGITVDWKDQIFEICYYQNKSMHDFIYYSIDTSENPEHANYIMAPSVIIEDILRGFYQTYALKCYSPYIVGRDYEEGDQDNADENGINDKK